MRVIVVHKIFIGSSIVMCGVITLTRLLRYRHTHDGPTLMLALGALVFIPVLSLYLRYIWKK